MGLNNLIYNNCYVHYRNKYLADGNGYVKLLPFTSNVPITRDNSSLVNPHTGVIFGDALKSCITKETLDKLKVIDPVNKPLLQIVLIGSELYINPLFRFGYKGLYMAQDVVLIGKFGSDNRELIKNIVELFNKKIIYRPHAHSIAVNNSKTPSKRALECNKFNNKFYSLKNYLIGWEMTPLGMYL